MKTTHKTGTKSFVMLSHLESFSMLNPFENAKGEASLQNHEVVGGSHFLKAVDSQMRKSILRILGFLDRRDA